MQILEIKIVVKNQTMAAMVYPPIKTRIRHSSSDEKEGSNIKYSSNRPITVRSQIVPWLAIYKKEKFDRTNLWC